jgi:outer membrane protein assembly factor BamB
LKILFYILLLFTVIVFSACSSKEVYKPVFVQDDWKYFGDSNVTINDISANAALVENHKVLVDKKVIDIKIPKTHKLLGYSDGWILSSSIDGNLTLVYAADRNMTEEFDLKRTIATASVKNDLLAVLFSNNEMALYSIASKSLLLKEQGEAPIVVNSKIVKPYFKDDLVIFSTLDGKIVIINSKEKKKLRSVIVSSEKHFNNVIYFNLIDNKIIAATGHKILSLSQKEIRSAYDIRNIVADDKSIYLATKQGEIISLTSDLQQNAKLKFPFAHFLGMIISGDKLYVLEKEGYIIEISKDLLKYTVYEVDIDDGYVYIDDKIFFVDNKYISVE